MSCRSRGFMPVALLPLALTCLTLTWSAPADAQDADRDNDRDAFAEDLPADDDRQALRQRANDGDWFRAPARFAGDVGPEDFPSVEVHDAVLANTRAATARAVYRRTESAMHAAVRSAEREFVNSKELREAMEAEERAYEAYEAARREALRDVANNAQYRAMLDLRRGLSDRIAGRHDLYREAARAYTSRPSVRLTSSASAPVALPPVAGDELLAMATLKMKVGTDARDMEREALQANENVRKARQELAAARAKVSEMRKGFDEKLRGDEELTKAREALEDARIARLAAETYLKGANLAAGEALDYAWRLRRYDYYRYSSRYDSYYPYRYALPHYGHQFVGGRP
jgi:hypothetical protein